MHLKRLFLSLALVLALACGATAGTTAQAATPANPLETIGTMGTLRTIDLMRVLKQSHGKVVLLTFWASWCSPCRAEVPELMTLRRTYGEEKLLILGLNVDNDPAAYADFVTKTGFTYPVRRADEGVQRLYRIQSIPRLLIYNPEGELVVDHEGMAPAKDLSKVIDQLLAEN